MGDWWQQGVGRVGGMRGLQGGSWHPPCSMPLGLVKRMWSRFATICPSPHCCAIFLRFKSGFWCGASREPAGQIGWKLIDVGRCYGFCPPGVEPQEPEGRAGAHAALPAHGCVCARAGWGGLVGAGEVDELACCMLGWDVLVLAVARMRSVCPTLSPRLSPCSGARHSREHQARLRTNHGPVCAARQAIRWAAPCCTVGSSGRPRPVCVPSILFGRLQSAEPNLGTHASLHRCSLPRTAHWMCTCAAHANHRPAHSCAPIPYTPLMPPCPPPVPSTPAASGLDVRYMKILKEEKNYSPSRWFRVVAMANSYQIRPH